MKPGDEVRLSHNPAHRGVLQQAQNRPRGRYWFVGLGAERPRWVPESQLEPVPSGPVTPLDILETGEYGTPSELRRVLTHIRVSGHPADMLYSMEATNTEFKAFQFKPVIKILESPSGRVLLADEVGLGKTIEAGLIWTELRSRFTLRRLLVLCPKPLREKWRRELSHRFGIDAEVSDASGLLKRLENRPRHASLHVIASFSSLVARNSKGGSPSPTVTPAHELEQFLSDPDHQPAFDLLVVDEAHHGRNPETRTHKLIALATEAASFVAFLSATPVHNQQQDLFSLLRLLDPDTFTEIEVLSNIQEANAPLIRARDTLRDKCTAATLREQLDQALLHPMVSESAQLHLIQRDLRTRGSDPLTPQERSELAYRLERINLLGHVLNRTRRRDVEHNRVVRQVVTEPVQMESLERAYYELVTGAVTGYADDHDTVEGFLLAQPQRQMASCFAASISAWFPENARATPNGTAGTEDDDTDGPFADRPLIAHIRSRIQGTLAAAGKTVSDLRVHLHSRDSKYSRLRDMLRDELQTPPHGKIVLFSTFRATLDYLSSRLGSDGIENVVLKGGQELSVDEILARFRADDGPPLLLSSEIGSEGLDLQFCRLLVNYDLPWNPMRIEQRIGRLDRIGQEADKIVIWTLLHEGTIDFRIQKRLFEKLDVFRQYLGDCEEVVAEELRKLTRALLSGAFTEEEQNDRIEQTAQAIEHRRTHEEQLEKEAAGLTAYGDYILDRISQARSMHRWLSAGDIDTYVTENLKRLYPGTRVVRPSTQASQDTRQREADTAVKLDLSATARADFESFLKIRRQHGDTRLDAPFGEVRCRFSNQLGISTPRDEEIITQFHPVTQFVAECLDDPDREKHLHAAVSGRLETHTLRDAGCSLRAGIYVLVIASAHFDGIRRTTHIKYGGEAMDSTVGPLTAAEAERLAIIVMSRGQAWLGARGTVNHELAHEIAERLFDGVEQEFEGNRKQEQAANDDRINLQLSAIGRQMRRDKESFTERATRYREQASKHRLHLQRQEAARFENLAKAMDKQCQNGVAKLERRRQQILRKREMQYNPKEEIAVAVIEVRESGAERS